ncbi:zinc transporter foi-like [Penaeus chinensis]|uniref:zinc transporter foi-like n=1 Tax=Penaeus chinensis TaxID=139456 RepID=UPI001FB64593|nr:zinc transporter foi-like [Penaeus chinensis]
MKFGRSASVANGATLILTAPRSSLPQKRGGSTLKGPIPYCLNEAIYFTVRPLHPLDYRLSFASEHSPSQPWSALELPIPRSWLYGVGGSCEQNVIPALKRAVSKDQVNHFLLALAVGTLAGDAFNCTFWPPKLGAERGALLNITHYYTSSPQAISMEAPQGSNPTLLHSFYGFTALGGIVIFLFLERCHNLFCGHGHGHGHSHGLGLDLSKSKEDIDKETVGTTTTLEDSASQITDKIGEKLSKHSKHNSFIYAESTMTLEAQNCFEGCSSNVSPSSDANGNNGPNRSRFGDDQQPTLPEKQGLVSSGDRDSEVASIDKHVAMCAEKEKLACSASEKESLVTTPADKSEIGRELSLILDTPSSGRPKVLRQNSSSFNMVLQEYHVGHHGHSHHGHSHVTGRKDSLRAMILVGDAMHTFLDGMAIGAAFGTSVTGGVATSIAVLCHELPHKVGDFALLFEMGMHLQQAVKMMALLWVLSLAGLLLGVMLGSIPTASPWIYSFTAGVFIYLALVDLLSELSVQRGEKFGVAGQLLLQGLGMLTGAVIMLIIAIYEHDLEDLLRGSF